MKRLEKLKVKKHHGNEAAGTPLVKNKLKIDWLNKIKHMCVIIWTANHISCKDEDW